jgi:pimeloyl-ACP methyl ester carboxylesterase
MVVVGANYHHEGLLPLRHMVEGSEEYLNWATKFAAVSPDGIGRAHIVFRKTELMQATEPTLQPSDLGTIRVPTLVMAGDDDVATLAHTASMYESIPGAQLAIVPGTSHGLLKERTKLCVRLIRGFLNETTTPETRMPVRRASYPS